MRTRRDLLKTAAAALPARGQHTHADGVLAQIAPYKPRVLKQAQMEWVAKLVDLIIPRSDTPGASDAGVPVYIDRTLSRNAAAKTRFLAGIAQLNAAAKKKFGSDFSKLDAAKQVELLTAISAEKSALGRFFKLVKDLTIEGYYTSKPGLTVELGWNANTFLPEFKGCTHPEHQA
jgi:glucoside 3-dehydrogenase (cytochrome c) hitch-hiker subunit